jgi:hypothetical protein
MLRFSDAKRADRSRNPSSNPQVANPASWNIERECGELLRSNGAREAEHGPTENEHDLHRPGGMAAQDAFGDDQGAEWRQRGR